MKLSVYDRLLLLGLLPQTGSYLNLKLIRKVREALSFTEQEHKALDFKERKDAKGETDISWNPDAVGEVDITFGPVVWGIVREKLLEMDKRGTLGNEHIGLYEKFNPTDEG